MLFLYSGFSIRLPTVTPAGSSICTDLNAWFSGANRVTAVFSSFTSFDSV